MKPMWKVTVRFISLMMIGFPGYKPTESVKIYRWWWRARLAQIGWNTPVMGWVVACADLEPYWPERRRMDELNRSIAHINERMRRNA